MLCCLEWPTLVKIGNKTDITVHTWLFLLFWGKWGKMHLNLYRMCVCVCVGRWGWGCMFVCVLGWGCVWCCLIGNDEKCYIWKKKYSDVLIVSARWAFWDHFEQNMDIFIYLTFKEGKKWPQIISKITTKRHFIDIGRIILFPNRWMGGISWYGFDNTSQHKNLTLKLSSVHRLPV